ncbi:MAG: hypothetical protein HY237_02865 [Acidobacteria bacterium]|nr:hypothetical protein [Acidobacteriota bacterium]
MRLLLTAALALLTALPASAQTWRPMGPPGGDVRSLGSDPGDPRRIYLGTSDGHIFGSTDAGEHWQLLGRAGSRLDAVVTAILVDPRDSRILSAATWTQNPAAGGGVLRSEDGGHTWRAAGLAGQAVRALARAPSNPDLLVAGTLEGVFRSADAARTWQRISPQGHEEIRNLDSVAIDPRDPQIIYVGTFHLPWKTTDGGRRWFPIHHGMIDDSDVMSILVDRTNPRRLYASACSGIYRSENSAAQWKKIQGIPFSARRTHVIRQDPRHPAVVYAATTEGLWKTASAGATWQRVTPHDWVITALAIPADRPNRLVMGTERLGVLLSDDGGAHFRAANEGFFHRQIVALALDRDLPGRVLAVLANAPEPILATEDGGHHWAPLGPGLKTQGLKRVYALPDGWWAALERGGLMRYDAPKQVWLRAGLVVGEAARPAQPARAAASARRGHRAPSAPRPAPRAPRPLDHVIHDMAFSRTTWFAATDQGLLASTDRGATWVLFPVGPLTTLPVRSVRASLDGQNLWAVSLRGLVFSRDAGKTWSWHDLPLQAGGALRLDVAPEAEYGQTLVAAAENGLYISRDGGRRWQQAASGLPEAPIQDLALVGQVFLASMQTGGLYISRDRGRTWARIEGTLAEGRFPVVTTPEAGSIIFAASATEGLYAVELDRPAATSSTHLQNP